MTIIGRNDRSYKTDSRECARGSKQLDSGYMSILETTRYGASAKILGRPRAPRFLAQGAHFDSSAPMARGASLGISLKFNLPPIFFENAQKERQL